MLLYTWIIPHMDNLGRLNGEPSEVRGLVLPRQTVTDRQVEGWLGELRSAGLVLWYEVEGLRYVAIPPDVWSREQRLHHNMSRTSDFPPPPEHLRTLSGAPTDIVPHEGEGKGEGEGEGETTPQSLRAGKPPSGRIVVEGSPSLMTNTGQSWQPTQTEIEAWSQAYVGLDVIGTLKEMAAWLIANPTRRKTFNGMPRFVNGWLAREQNRL